MAVSLLLSRILGMLRDTVMVSQFGIGIDTDAFRIAFSIPDLLFMLIAGGGLSSAFIPVFSEYLHTDREDEAWNIFSVVTTVSVLIVTVLIGLAWMVAPAVAHYMAEGKTQIVNGQKVVITDQLVPKIVEMSRVMLPAQFAFLIGSIVLGTLYARQRFAAPGLAPNIYNAGIILGAVIGGGTLGIMGMAWGVLVGAAVGNLVLPLFFMFRLGGRYRPSLNLRTPGVKRFFTLLLPVILGFSLPSVCGLITTKFASMYGEGINTVMNISNNLMQAPLGIFGHALALAAFPVLSQFYAQKKTDLYRDQVSRTLRTTIYLGAPSAAIMLAAAPEIVSVLYGYGHGQDAVLQHQQIAVALRIFALGVISWCMQPVLMRGFFSVQKTLLPIALSTGMTALFILLCWANGKTSLGYVGLPIATDIAATLLVIVLVVALEREVGSLDRKGLAITIGKCLLGATVMGVAVFGAFQVVHLESMGKWLAIPIFALVFLSGIWLYYLVTKALNMPETAYFARALARLDRRKRPIAAEEAHND